MLQNMRPIVSIAKGGTITTRSRGTGSILVVWILSS